MTCKVPTFRETMSCESYKFKRFSKTENLFRATKGSEFLKSLKKSRSSRLIGLSSNVVKQNIVGRPRNQVNFLDFFYPSKHLFSKF